MKTVILLYNPASGEGLVAELLDQLVEVHQRHGLMLMPYRLTFSARQSGEILSLIGPSLRHILAAGGDGTVNYVVNLLRSNNLDVPLAVLPAGTANDFASLFDMPTDPVKACERLLSAGRMRRIDLGRAGDRYFVNVFSCGLFTDVSQRTPTLFKNTFGKLAYYVGGLGELPKFRRMNLTIRSDGGDYEGASLIFFVFNGQTAGRLRIAYLSEVDDGLLDVLIIKGDNPGETLHTIFHYLLTRTAKDYPPGIVHLRCTRLQVESASPEPTDIDGQAGPALPLEITCCKGALRMLVPGPKTKGGAED